MKIKVIIILLILVYLVGTGSAYETNKRINIEIIGDNATIITLYNHGQVVKIIDIEYLSNNYDINNPMICRFEKFVVTLYVYNPNL